METEEAALFFDVLGLLAALNRKEASRLWEPCSCCCCSTTSLCRLSRWVRSASQSSWTIFRSSCSLARSALEADTRSGGREEGCPMLVLLLSDDQRTLASLLLLIDWTRRWDRESFSWRAAREEINR